MRKWSRVCVVPWAILIFLSARGTALPAQAPQLSGGQSLFGELGCAHCHFDSKISSSLRERTPDLSSAGLRYNPAYLFEYLQNPLKVRRHLGRARMPDFRLSDKEALALTAFLQEQRKASGQWPELPPEVQTQLGDPPRQISEAEFQGEVGKGLICFTCHTLDGKGGPLGVELGQISYRLQRDWAKIYLVAPARFGVPHTTMPAQFYQVAADGRRFQEIVPQAARKIQVLTDYLFSLNAEKHKALAEKFNAAKAAFPNANSALGEKIFRSQNCAACHRHHAIQPRLTNAAPDLALEGKRVNRDWLENFLRHPVALRPFGYRPGDGSRMPDFRLSAGEASELTTFLASNSGEETNAFRPVALSAFAKRKAELLLSEKLSCLGCHRLGEKGGRIGPDLAAVGTRLQPDYIYRMIRDPRALNPHTIMPRIPMSEELIRLISNFLAQQREPARDTKYLSLVDNPAIEFETVTSGPGSEAGKKYFSHCAACHGSEGAGNGFNAQFLPVRPTIHADPKAMAIRPDDTLFDAIHSGGYIVNKSQFMPPWGGSLTTQEIKGLVGFMRALCQCQEPSWARDNSLPAAR
jgi:mono/diheme cytochrome c family protein